MSQDLERYLAAAADDARGAVRLTPADRVRARGDRRRLVAVTVGAAAAAIVVTAMLVGKGVVASHPIQPAGPPGAVPTKISEALRLPSEGDPDWVRDDDRRVRAAFTGCRSDDPTLPGRTDARTMTRRSDAAASPQPSPTEQLFLYDSDRAAATALAAIEPPLEQCGWAHADLGYGYPLFAWSDMHRVEAFRRRNAVFLVYGELGDMDKRGTPIPGGPGPIESMTQELCVKMAMCTDGPSPRLTDPPPEPSPTPTG